jgi:hypothetical protein
MLIAFVCVCHVDEQDGKNAVCAKVQGSKGKAASYNGITVSPDGKRILATDSPLVGTQILHCIAHYSVCS